MICCEIPSKGGIVKHRDNYHERNERNDRDHLTVQYNTTQQINCKNECFPSRSGNQKERSAIAILKGNKNGEMIGMM